MAEQTSISAETIIEQSHPDDGTTQILPDVAYRRLAIVNVVFFGLPECGDRQWVLIDTGVAGMSGRIISAADERFGKGSRPAAIILTHGRSDHVGNLEHLAEKWEVPIYAHPLEWPYLDGSASYPPADTSVGGGIMPHLAPLFSRGPINVASRLNVLASDHSLPGMPGWRWIHTPGHAPGHVSLWHEADRTLIAGDAFITTNQESASAIAMQSPEMHGPPKFLTPDWEAADRSVEILAALEPEVVITGHGKAMSGPSMREALHALSRNFQAVAVPEKGLYVDHPARAEDGSAYWES